MAQLVSLNGAIVDYDDGRIPLEDRGYQFGDGVYEVVRVYNGRPFTFEAHFARLQRSAQAIHLAIDPERLQRDALRLIDAQGLAEATLYVQVTRGVAPRNHAFPAEARPTVVMLVRAATKPADSIRREGVAAITLADDRWARCYIKSINLLPNVLAKQQAVTAGAYEALYLRDGFLTEGSSANAYVVIDQTLITPPKSNYILGGITREVILQIAQEDGIPAREESVPAETLRQANEVMVSSTTAEIVPIVRIDDRPVGNGRPGPVFARLLRLFEARVARECGVVATTTR